MTMTRTSRRSDAPSLVRSASHVGAILLALGGGTLLAHENDPKAKRTPNPYPGPGWRLAEGGVAGGPEFAASGVALQSWLTFAELDPTGGSNAGNDCWGYTSPSGREYAIMGTSNGTSFVDVTDPTDATLVAFQNGPNSTWRDIKTYDQYAYVVSEGGGGIQVYDLGGIDSGDVTFLGNVNGAGSNSTHNVALDEVSGFLYRCGGGNNVGLRIYDLNDDPSSPQFVGSWLDRYVHDVQVVTYEDGPYAGRQIAFCCAGFNNGGTETALDIVDVTDKSNPVLLSRLPYPGARYSHQGWLTPDRRFFLLGDELDEGSTVETSTLYVINVEDIAVPRYRGAFENGNPAITHNIYTLGELGYIANYRSGLRVLDIRDPENMREVGFFDTFPNNDAAAYDGLWSVYPYFQSGTIIGSDIDRGLFVWSVDVSRVDVEITTAIPETIPLDGFQVTGTLDAFQTSADPADVAVIVSTSGGELSFPAVATGPTTFSATLSGLPCPEEVSIRVRAIDENDRAFESDSVTTTAAATSATLFEDDFNAQADWLVTGDVFGTASGQWERGVPAGEGTRGDPTVDADGSGACFLTGNGPGTTDVDGMTILTSPPIATPAGSDPLLAYWRWYDNTQGPWPGQDVMRVEISSELGANWTLVEEIGPSGGDVGAGWVRVRVRASDFVEIGEFLQIRFIVTDGSPDSVVEAAVDGVLIDVLGCEVEPSTPGDLDGDGDVDGADLGILLGSWGGASPDADVNGDGAVDGIDLGILLGNWS